MAGQCSVMVFPPEQASRYRRLSRQTSVMIAGTRGTVRNASAAALRVAAELASPEVPASLVRLGRTARFRQAATAIATALDVDPDDFSARLVSALAALADTMGKDLAEPDWWRILDALLLIAAYPTAPQEGRKSKSVLPERTLDDSPSPG